MKNLFPTFFLMTGLAGAATTAQAQSAFSIGPRLGLNMATVATSGENASEVNPENIFTPQVGVTLDMSFGNNFAFQPSLLYSQKGFKTSESSTDNFGGTTVTYSANASLRIGYLEMPLNFVYTTGGTQGFQLFAGPYVAMGVGGRAPYSISVKDNTGQFDMEDSGAYSVKFANKQNDNSNGDDIYLRRFDIGANVGMGYRQGPVQVQLGYGFGLSNLVPLDSDGSDSGEKAQNRVLQLSANYFFNGK